MVRYARKTRKVFRKTYKPKTAGVKALRMVKAIKRTYKPEYKKIDLGAVTTTAGFIPTGAVLHGVAQGDSNITRNANKILVKSISMKGYVQHNNTATIGQMVRIWIIQDTQQVGDTTPVAGDIWQVAASSVTSPLNRDSVGRFKILWSKSYIVDPSSEMKQISMYKRLTLPIRYNGTTASDIQKNGIYVFIASTDDTNKPSVVTNIRVNFIDN